MSELVQINRIRSPSQSMIISFVSQFTFHERITLYRQLFNILPLDASILVILLSAMPRISWESRKENTPYFLLQSTQTQWKTDKKGAQKALFTFSQHRKYEKYLNIKCWCTADIESEVRHYVYFAIRKISAFSFFAKTMLLSCSTRTNTTFKLLVLPNLT